MWCYRRMFKWVDRITSKVILEIIKDKRTQWENMKNDQRPNDFAHLTKERIAENPFKG